MTNKEFDLDDTDRKLLKDLASSGNSNEAKGNQNSGGMGLINTYTIQWKGLEPVYCKISSAESSEEPYMRIISEEYYKKNQKQIEKQVANDEFIVEKYLREILWTATRIHTGIYTKAKKEKNLIQRLNENNKYNVDFDYSGMLLSTVDGIRVSVQEIIKELEKIYDAIRFQINRELKKIKGTMVAFDEAFIPVGKNINDIIHSITEDGMVRFNSSAEGNVSGTELDSNKVGVSAINLGQNQNLLVLLQQAIDIERVMDRVTGMNEGRQGLQKATTTATANVNNIEASRSMTYDLFYFMQEFIERTLTKLAEKTKINKTYIGADQRQFIFDEGEEMFMISTKELDWDNYGITITDGKKEKDILNKMEMLFPQEINAGNLRSGDAGKFWMESSFASALRVLDNAHEQLANIRQQEMRVKQESAIKNMEQQSQQIVEEREDNQSHDIDMETLRTEGKKEVVLLGKSLDSQNDSSKIAGKAATTPKKQNAGIL
jgi:hypothetical protein